MVFTLQPPFPATSLLPLMSALPLGRTCSVLLFFNFEEEKKRGDQMICLYQITLPEEIEVLATLSHYTHVSKIRDSDH
jgi:hypothetical protein